MVSVKYEVRGGGAGGVVANKDTNNTTNITIYELWEQLWNTNILKFTMLIHTPS